MDDWLLYCGIGAGEKGVEKEDGWEIGGVIAEYAIYCRSVEFIEASDAHERRLVLNIVFKSDRGSQVGSAC